MLLSGPMVITPKTPTLNPNADVFHSLSPPVAASVAMPTHPHPSDYLSASSSSSPSSATWITEPSAAAAASVQPPNLVASITNLPGDPLLNGGNLATPAEGGIVQMTVVYPPTPPSTLVPSPAGSEYAPVAMNGCPIQDGVTQALFASESDARTSTDEMGPLEDFVEAGQLRVMLKRQLEYYFSRENLASDTYLVSQMDADQFVPITTVASFNQVKRLTRNIELVIEVLRESGNVQVDDTGEKVRPMHKRCIVILREIPDSTPIEDVERLFSSDSCPPFISCQFAHNSSWYVTFDTEEDAQRAYRYLREEVKTFLGMPIMARIKAKPLLRSSYLTKESSSDFSPNIYQQPKFSYTSPVPSIQYIPPQNLPFFTPHASMSPVWSASVVYYDPGMAFAANGYVPTATFTPPSAHPAPPNPQQCSTELQSPRTRTMRTGRYGNRAGSLDHGNDIASSSSDFDYHLHRRSWHQPSTTRVVPLDNDESYHSSYDTKRPPRYAGTTGGGPRGGGGGGRSEFFRGGGGGGGTAAHKVAPMSPRNGADHRGGSSGGRGSHPVGVARASCGGSDNEVFHYGSAASAVGSQGSQGLVRLEGAVDSGGGVSSSEANVVQSGRESAAAALPQRSGGSYKSRRRSRPSLSETSKVKEHQQRKNSMSGVQSSGATTTVTSSSSSFELQEKSFPPLPGSLKLSVLQNDRSEIPVADVVRGTVATTTTEASKSNSRQQPSLSNINVTAALPLSVAAVVRVSFADDAPTSTSANASLSSSSLLVGMESVATGNAVTGGNAVGDDVCCPAEQESLQSKEKADDEGRDSNNKRVVLEITGTTTTLHHQSLNVSTPDYSTSSSSSVSVASSASSASYASSVVCSVSSIVNQPSSFESPASYDESCYSKSSQKLSYAQMALRGKERQGSKPSSNLDPTATTSGFESTLAPSVNRRQDDDDSSPVRYVARNVAATTHRASDNAGCRALRRHDVRKCETVPAWN